MNRGEAKRIKKVLKENSISGRSWSPAKLFIMQNYTDNANEDVLFTVENMSYVSLSSRCAHVLLGSKAKLLDRFLKKYLFSMTIM